MRDTGVNSPAMADAGRLVVQSYLDRLLADNPGADAEVVQVPAPAICADAADALTDVSGTDTPTMPAGDRDEEWRAKPFQALLFQVHAVQFAAPLIRLQGVVPWSEEIADLPETPDWFLGLLACRDHNVRVVDTAKLVMQGQKFDVESSPGHIILLDKGRWGMTCDGLNEVVNVAPQSVQWRARKANRPWLAGTLREKLCAVLDVGALARMLERASA